MEDLTTVTGFFRHSFRSDPLPGAGHVHSRGSLTPAPPREWDLWRKG